MRVALQQLLGRFVSVDMAFVIIEILGGTHFNLIVDTISKYGILNTEDL